VRRFQQDDAHIFCRREQIPQEVEGVIDFLESVYGIFKFDFDLELSTRPEKFLGDVAVWDAAEASLKKVLDDYSARSGRKWKLNPGDGAFYGPKIDIHIKDALKRSFQCGTCQLDFQLPLRFGLKFTGPQGEETPVIIHRAILGSVERFLGILIEHVSGKWPLWVSPRQVSVIPVAAVYEPYAKEVVSQIHDAGFYVELDDSDNTLNKKIRDAQLAQFNFILVVGEKEVKDRSVNVRTRDNEVKGEKPIQEFISELRLLSAQKK